MQRGSHYLVKYFYRREWVLRNDTAKTRYPLALGVGLGTLTRLILGTLCPRLILDQLLIPRSWAKTVVKLLGTGLHCMIQITYSLWCPQVG